MQFQQPFSIKKNPFSIYATPTTEDVVGGLEVVAITGTCVILDSAGNKLEKGKFIVLWKQETGIWKMYRDIWNSDASPLPPPSVPV